MLGGYELWESLSFFLLLARECAKGKGIHRPTRMDVCGDPRKYRRMTSL